MDSVVVVGSLNMDTNIRVPHIPMIGETIIASDINNYSGGKGANQAISIARLGGNVEMIGAVGNDKNGDILLSRLKKEKVGTEGLLIKKGVSTGFAIISVSDAGDNNIIVYSGANYSITKSDIDKNIKIIKSSKYCVLQFEIPYNIVEYVIDVCKKNKTKVILNPAPGRNKIDSELLEKVDFLIPNESELMIISDNKVNKDNMVNICEEIVKKGCENVIVTCGDKGSLWVNDEGYKYYEAISVKALDTTGAGDSFIGGFAYMLSEGKNIDEAIKFATRVAGITVTRKGAQDSLPTIEEVNKI